MKNQHLILVLLLLLGFVYKTWQAYDRGQSIKQLEVTLDKVVSNTTNPNSQSFGNIYGKNPPQT